MMPHTILRAATVAAITLTASAAVAQPSAPNTLTPAETAAGWTLLFDGTTPAGLRGYKAAAFPAKGWVVEDGALKVVKGGGGGDIVSKEEYEDFELSLEFKCAPGANSGIMYRVAETKDYPWMTGPEYQILDNAGHKDGADIKHTVGALYDLIEPKDPPAAPPGEWNEARIRVKDGVLQHYLNGKKVVECRIDTPEWKERIAGSKFKQWPGFGLESKGRIALQDHGDDVWFRNIKVRDLNAKMPEEVSLFNGTDLKGWTAQLNDGATIDQAFSVKDGAIICTGNPVGYIRTAEAYTNYVLKLEWRYTPEKPGNSGVLLRVQSPDKVWPKSIEAQLLSGNAGYLLTIDDAKMTTDESRKAGRQTKHTHNSERPVGAWNEYEIVVDGERLTLRVNGEEVNNATGLEVVPGWIALQSEGVPIHFRSVRLAPIGGR